jgi:L-ascorbate metabolism protein UlaG (beta-lactamase superfamily)
LRAAQDMKAKMLIPMHYGTYDISAEPLNEPLEIIQSLEIPENIELKIVNI